MLLLEEALPMGCQLRASIRGRVPIRPKDEAVELCVFRCTVLESIMGDYRPYDAAVLLDFCPSHIIVVVSVTTTLLLSRESSVLLSSHHSKRSSLLRWWAHRCRL